ncbi:MAG TPA: hypothetical protein VMB84_11930 [Stellaceae bacterium]|nr:hypothetical protein [Stellaceae bacterium]
MTRLGAGLLSAALLAATAASAAEPAHRIVQQAAWGCRDRNELIDLLFLGLSTSFDTKLADALGDGRCIFFAPDESVTIIRTTAHGLVQVQRAGPSAPAYWTAARNVD